MERSQYELTASGPRWGLGWLVAEVETEAEALEWAEENLLEGDAADLYLTGPGADSVHTGRRFECRGGVVQRIAVAV